MAYTAEMSRAKYDTAGQVGRAERLNVAKKIGSEGTDLAPRDDR